MNIGTYCNISSGREVAFYGENRRCCAYLVWSPLVAFSSLLSGLPSYLTPRVSYDQDSDLFAPNYHAISDVFSYMEGTDYAETTIGEL